MSRLAVLLAALALAGVASGAGPSGERPVVVHGCEGLYYEGGGKPDAIVVSDLPLEHSAYTAMHQMTQAIKLTLKDRGFRAGRFTVGYVVCDDSGDAGTASRMRCVANARAAARVPKVVGVIGTLESSCAVAELPVLARAGVVLVSPLNTAVELTRPHLGPVARLSAPDDAQAGAAARFLRGLGARRIAVLSDGTRRGDAYRASFRRAAEEAGLSTTRRGADAAYVGGILSGTTPGVLRAARRAAGDGAIVLAGGFGPVAQLVSLAGSLADGTYLAVAGLPLERLPRAGARFVAHFETALHTEPHPYAVSAAQSVRILLAAIAGSDGSRSEVARAVARTSLADGLIGSLKFDRNGDPVGAPVTVYRVRAGSPELVRVVHSGVP
jgi:branched-chain amino acid transport system substrate-binding protein